MLIANWSIQPLDFALNVRFNPLPLRVCCVVIYSLNRLRVADTLHIIFAAAMLYHYLITDPTDPGIVWSYKVCMRLYFAFSGVLIS
jgi:hypothetical protein